MIEISFFLRYNNVMKVYLDNCVEAEYFIAAVQREHFDYTKWQREHFDNMDLRTFVKNAAEYAHSIGK